MEGLTGFIPMILIFVVFYFFFIRPQATKQKEQANFVDSLKKGDEIVTASGIIGKINKIEGNSIHVQVDQKTFIKMLKSSANKEMTEAYTAN